MYAALMDVTSCAASWSRLLRSVCTAPSRAVSAPWIEPAFRARAVGVAPAVIWVPLKATGPVTAARLTRTTGLPEASFALTWTWPLAPSVAVIGSLVASCSSTAWRWSRRSTAEPGLLTSKRPIWALRSATFCSSWLTEVTSEPIWVFRSVCTCARLWSADCRRSVRMAVFWSRVWRWPTSVGLAASPWKALNTSSSAAPMPLSVVLEEPDAASVPETDWPRPAWARW